MTLEKTIVLNSIEYYRVILECQGKQEIVYVKSLDDVKYYQSKLNIDNDIYEMKDYEDFLDWFLDNYKDYGTELYLVSNNTSEGTQLEKGFGGLGGILRWNLEFDYDNYNNINNEYEEESEDSDEEEEYDFF